MSTAKKTTKKADAESSDKQMQTEMPPVEQPKEQDLAVEQPKRKRGRPSKSQMPVDQAQESAPASVPQAEQSETNIVQVESEPKVEAIVPAVESNSESTVAVETISTIEDSIEGKIENQTQEAQISKLSEPEKREEKEDKDFGLSLNPSESLSHVLKRKRKPPLKRRLSIQHRLLYGNPVKSNRNMI